MSKEEQPTPDAASQALIEQFLEAEGSTSAPETDWHTIPLPEGHKGGFVALIGRPNVGKSTLVNALLGQKIAIVSDKPQTTRRRITGILTQPEAQIIFVDTPGIHQKPHQLIGTRMVEAALGAIPDADVILFVVDVSAPPRDEDRYIASLLSEKTHRPVLLTLNKMDQLAMKKAETHISAYWDLLPNHAESLPVSATRGTNLDMLLARILEHLPAGPRYYPGDQITDQTERQIAAELIREGMLRYTYQEVPHASAVIVDEYTERDDGHLYIAATLWIERASQKGIIIGKGGEMLKRIGSAARQELERFVGNRVYLELYVKVRPDWRNREHDLREAGVV